MTLADRTAPPPADRGLRSVPAYAGMAAILAAFVALGVGYSLATPILEASDERWHYPLVRHIAETGRLPVQDAAARADWHQEGSQPPLYYLVAAALTAGIDTSDFEAVHAPNPHAVVGEPLVAGNKNMMIHTQRESWPWHGTSLAVHMVRLLSVALGAVTVWLTYRLAWLAWPADRRVALLAATLTAFNPMFIFISASVNNDNLAAPLAAGGLLVTLSALQRGPTWRDGLWLGILLGLGAITKLSVLALVPLVGAALTWDAARHHGGERPHAWRAWLINVALIGVLMLVIAGWWYWRNFTLYGDPTGLSRMLEIAGRRHEALTLGRLWYEFEGFRITYWGLFGALNILMDRWIYSVLDGLAAVAGVGVVVVLSRGWLPAFDRRTRRGVTGARAPAPIALILVLIWVALVLASLIRWTSQTYASQGRLMFVAIAGISTLLATGWLGWFPSRLRWPAAGLAGGGLFLLSVISPIHYVAPAYLPPPLVRESQLPADVQRVNWDINGELRLLGYRVEPTTASRALPTVRPFEAVPLTIYWQALAPMTTDYSVFVHLLGQQHTVIGQVNTYPGLGLRPTTQLQPGDVVADTYQVQVAADAAAPTLVRVHAGLYRYADPGRPALEAINADGERVEPWLTTVKLVPWAWPTTEPEHSLSVRIGDAIDLLGYDLTEVSDRRALTLYWRANARPPADYTVFIQVWAGDAQVAGFDGRPVGGDYPTDWWEAGEVILDEHLLDLSALPPGRDYRLLTGLYRLDTGERLPAYGASGPLPDYAVEVGLTQK